MKKWKDDLRKREFGKWKVVRYSHYYRKEGSSKGTSYWICKCKCGNIRAVSRKHLIAGNSLSCGCMFRRKGIHNMTHSATYMSWNAMKGSL